MSVLEDYLHTNCVCPRCGHVASMDPEALQDMLGMKAIVGFACVSCPGCTALINYFVRPLREITKSEILLLRVHSEISDIFRHHTTAHWKEICPND